MKHVNTQSFQNSKISKFSKSGRKIVYDLREYLENVLCEHQEDDLCALVHASNVTLRRRDGPVVARGAVSHHTAQPQQTFTNWY